MTNAATTNSLQNRWVPVIASFVLQLCLGTAYIWSVFQIGIATRLFGGDNAAASLTFSFLLGVLTFGSTFGGMLQDKFSPRPVLIGGGIILGTGFILASLTTPSMPHMLWLTYGVMGGIGMGTLYSTTIACCQKWFPDKRGLITGLIVSALGFGGVVFTPVAEKLIAVLGQGVPGVGELKTFAYLGVIFMCLSILGALFIKNPPTGFRPSNWTPTPSKDGSLHQDFTPIQMLKTPQFYAVTITFMFACMAGLMVIGFAKPIALAKGIAPSEAAIGVMIIAIFNSFGRLFWGWSSDKIGRKNTIMLLLLMTASTILLVKYANGYLIFALIAVIAFSYGGFLGVFPALTADFWGIKNMGTNYGIIMVGFGLGAVIASFIAGYYKNIAADDINLMFPAFVIASFAAGIAAIITFFIKPPRLKLNK